MTVVATDLDGTLLDPGAVLGPQARRALGSLRRAGIPVVPLTSKTAEELSLWLDEIGCGRWGSFENGAGILGPDGIEIALNAVQMDDLSRTLSELARRTGLLLRPLARIPDPELLALTGLSGESARRARERRFDLPFLAPGDSGPALERALPPRVALVRGGLFWHLSGAHDKGTALSRLLERYPLEPPVIGLGDAPNDAPFLARCDRVAIVPGPAGESAELRGLFPRALAAPRPGGSGWAEGVAALVESA